jgi:hypothetical protein
VRDQCRALLRKSFAATVPALEKLGVTTGLDELARTYTTSIEAKLAIRSCAKLSEVARACLLGAANPIAAAPGCAPGERSRPSALELPPLFSFFGPCPLCERLHPRIDERAGRAVRASLVGTWVRKDRWSSDTWKVDAAGNATITRTSQDEPPETRRYRLEVKVAGEIELHERGSGHTSTPLFMPSPDRFYEVEATPVTDEQRFVVPIGDAFLIREPGGCSVVTREGALVPASCEVQVEDGARTLRLAYTPPCGPQRPGACPRTSTLELHPGWVVSQRLRDRDKFVRR